MFLFRGDFGCLLYTGDFRWETRSERAKQGRTMLVDALNDSTVDILYLDNTYCNPSYDFPPREVAAQQVSFRFVTELLNHYKLLSENWLVMVLMLVPCEFTKHCAFCYFFSAVNYDF